MMGQWNLLPADLELQLVKRAAKNENPPEAGPPEEEIQPKKGSPMGVAAAESDKSRQEVQNIHRNGAAEHENHVAVIPKNFQVVDHVPPLFFLSFYCQLHVSAGARTRGKSVPTLQILAVPNRHENRA